MAAPRRMLGTPSETEAAHVAAQGLVRPGLLPRGTRGGRGGVTPSRLRTWWRCYQDLLDLCLYPRPMARGSGLIEGRYFETGDPSRCSCCGHGHGPAR